MSEPIMINENRGIEMVKAGAEVISKTEPRDNRPTTVVLRVPFEGRQEYQCLTDHPELFNP